VHEWHRTFADAVAATHTPASGGGIVGVEHEYRVLRDSKRIAFDTLIGGLALGRRYLDPTDANAYRLASGAAVTCDEREAELALPPVDVQPGFTAEISRRIASEQRQLQRGLGDGYELVGVSTHISVQVEASPESTDALARLYAETFGPPMMLLLDRHDSWGVYVRPRPGRLEICGEFARGARLRAAIVFAVGSVRACLDVVEGTAPAPSIPLPLRLRLTSSGSRFSYTVWRTSSVGNLYERGRDAHLARRDTGDWITAQGQLEQAWAAARAALPALDAAELAGVERFVNGTFALPVTPDFDDKEAREERAPAPLPIAVHPYGRLVAPISRPGYELACVMATWPIVVLLAATLPKPRQAFVCVPRTSVPEFCAALDLGSLDAAIRGYLASPPRRRRLERHAQAAAPGLWDELGHRRGLLPAEPIGPLTSTGATA
jgi:hypothetical protein